MKFSPLSVLFLSTAASAWTSTAPSSRRFLATQFHAVATATVGEEATESFRLKFTEGESEISPWHDIDLMNEDGSYNMVR